VAEATTLKADEKALARRLQEEGKWRHLWRIAGQYSNVSIFDVADVEEAHFRPHAVWSAPP